MSNDKDTGSLYSYDPFGTGGSQSRWGRRGSEDPNVPVIAGYEVMDKLGSGGMGSVWTARYLALNQVRAVKVLSQDLADDPSFLERFAQEAKAMARLEHPNIVKVFDANAEHRPPYIAMQWVEGETLSQILSKRSVPLAEATKYFDQVAQALDYAHSLGFVHRDIKPSNVMITKDGRAMLIDFGVASALGNDPGQGHTITGTTRYLSPEVCEGRMATSSSDIWALGVLIYRTLAGDLPFNDKSDDAVRKKILTEEPANPRGVSPRIRKFLINALEKDPAKRYKTAGKMVQDLKWVSTPLVPKVKGDGSKLFGSIALFAGGAVIIAGVGGTFWYTAFRHRNEKPTETVVIHDGPSEDGTFKPIKGSTDTSLKVATAPGMKDLKGVWFADLGTQWEEVVITPTGGKAFKASLEVRDSRGLATLEATGQLGSDGKAVTFTEAKILSNPGNVDYVPTTFTGAFSDDRSQVSGTHGAAGGATVRLVRATDLVMTPYDNSALGFSAALPPGWTSADSTSGSDQITTFTPTGSPDVQIRVIVEPAAGNTVEAIFATRETGFQAQSGYQRVGVNSQTTLGGRNAVCWDFRKQVNGVTDHCLAYGVLRGDSSVTVETWVPTDKEAVWSPVLERFRQKFQFTG